MSKKSMAEEAAALTSREGGSRPKTLTLRPLKERRRRISRTPLVHVGVLSRELAPGKPRRTHVQ